MVLLDKSDPGGLPASNKPPAGTASRPLADGWTALSRQPVRKTITTQSRVKQNVALARKEARDYGGPTTAEQTGILVREPDGQDKRTSRPDGPVKKKLPALIPIGPL